MSQLDDVTQGAPTPTETPPEPTGERLYAGKYKSPEELESAYSEAQRAITQRGTAFSTLKGTLEQAGYQVDEAGQIVGGPQAAAPEPEPEYVPVEDEIASLKREIAALKGVANVTTLSVAEAEKQKALAKVPETLREQAGQRWDQMVATMDPTLRNPQTLGAARKLLLGELMETSPEAWAAPLNPQAEDARTAGQVLAAGGGAERPSGTPSRRPATGTDLEREVAREMVRQLKETHGITMTVDEYLADVQHARRESFRGEQNG